ncbi:MAG: serine hydrolase domain-containing protein [Ktedonobacterales bacterium]
MSEPKVDTTTDTGQEALDAQMPAALARWHIPGATVGIWQNGKLLTRGYGITSLETGQPVAADTLFQIGSISKVFTATLVMMLVEEGKLALDTPVVTYLPELRLADETVQASVTLRHLLTHTAGFYGDFFDDFGLGDDALSKCIAQLHTLRQYTPPGSLWAYCNAGFYLAGAVLERVTGKPFETVMRERLFEPLGLQRSFFFAHEAIVYSAAIGHTQKTPGGDEHEVARLYPLPRNVAAAGGIISCVGDLLTFARLHLNGGELNGKRLLSEDAVRQMQTLQTPAANFADAYGLGWALDTKDGQRIVGHGGSTNGFNAHLTLVPEHGFALAQLTNSSRGSALNEEIEKWSLEHYCGITSSDPEQQTMLDEALAVFAGRYEQPTGMITFTIHEGGLQRTMILRDVLNDKEETYPPDQLLAIGEREFIVITEGENKGSKIDFILGDDGKPQFVRMGGRLADRTQAQ